MVSVVHASGGSAMSKIVFENEHIQVTFTQGDSTYLLITFGDQSVLARQGRFFAESVVRQNQLSCLGFMAKTPNWYPKVSMIAAEIALRNILSQFDQKILHGDSMGGYAALKYSELFNASCVIAYVPQWSIDPNDCLPHDKRHVGYYSEENLQDMSIKSSDLYGSLFVFSDPFFSFDQFHLGQIKSISEKINIINMHSSTYAVAKILNSEECLYDIITYCLNQDEDSIYKLIRKQRQHNKYRINTIIQRATGKHYQKINQIACKMQASEDFFSDLFYKNAVANLLKKLEKDLDHEDFISLVNKFNYFKAAASIMQQQDSPQPLININHLFKSHHDSYLAYDVISEKLCCVDTSDFINKAYIFPIYPDQEYGVITIKTKNSIHPVTFSEKKFSISHISSEINPFIIFRKVEKHYVLIYQDYYASVKRSGAIEFNVHHIQAWEKFTVEHLSDDGYNPILLKNTLLSDDTSSLPDLITARAKQSKLLTYTYFLIISLIVIFLGIAALSS